MVSSKNRNYHRNHGCNLVEIAFAVGVHEWRSPTAANQPALFRYCSPSDFYAQVNSLPQSWASLLA